MTFAGASTWSGGAMSGTGRTIIAQGGTLAMSATSTTATLSRILENRGTATLSTSTNLWIWNAGTFLNTANATFVANITSGTFTARGGAAAPTCSERRHLPQAGRRDTAVHDQQHRHRVQQHPVPSTHRPAD
ncbi:MAG: hypothetical protein IPK26_13070 [Planctomycetes bacterium]|nr:hypothetical protein [Planctomycetota bacterium]